MSFHPLFNGANRQKTPKNPPIIYSDHVPQRIRQKHVTFRQGSNNNSIIKSDSKPKYHFTYGQPHQIPSFSPTPAQSQFLHQQNSFYSRTPLQTSPHQNIQTELYKNLSNNLLQERNPSSKKKKLKIFPQKYDAVNKSQPVETKNEELKQIGQLKGEIQRLRQEISNLTLNLSKNTSRDFTESIYRNQADRTKRLSELNEFNQKLYSQLAMKLKQISLEQYQNALQIQNSNVKFLQSVYSSAAKQKSRNQTFQIDKIQQDHHKFMDIQEFEKEYQEKLGKAEDSPSRTLNFDKNAQSSKIQLESPFLVRQNKFQTQNFKTIQQDQLKRKQKGDPFTFHKTTNHQQNQFAKSKQQILSANEVFQKADADKNIKEMHPNKQNTQNQTKPYPRKPFNIENLTKQKRQIHDMNRQIENKIMKKRSASEYAYLARTRKY